MTNLRSLRQRAQAGDPNAIATLINQSFQKYRLRAEVQTKESRLVVRLTGQSAPAPKLAVGIQRGLLNLRLTSFAELVVMGFAVGDETATWMEQLSLLSTTGTMATPAQSHAPLGDSVSTPLLETDETPLTAAASTSESQSFALAAMRQKQHAQVLNQQSNMTASSRRSLPKKWLGIGLCLVLSITGGSLYKNWWRLQNAMGRIATPEDICYLDRNSQFFLASGGRLEQFRLGCVMDNPRSIDLWMNRTANNPNQVDASNSTLLQVAVRFGKVDIVRKTLAQGASPNVGEARSSPLVYAASGGSNTPEYFEMVKLLLDQGADVDNTWTASDGTSENALTWAIRRNDLTIAQMLVDAGMRYSGGNAINLKGIGQGTNFELLNTLIDQGLDLNERDSQIAFPVDQAINQGNTALLRLLLDRGATLNGAHQQKRLNRAIRANQQDIVAVLLAQGSQNDNEGSGPGSSVQGNSEGLVAAVANNSLSLVRTLLDQDADINQVDETGYTPLTKAVVVQASSQLVQLLLSRGADVNQIDGRKFTPLSLAAQSSLGHPSKMIELLLSQGAQINQLDGNGYTPLMQAVFNSKYDAIDLLVAKGADINQTSADGRSALAIAIAKSPQLVDYLLEKGGNFDRNHPWPVVYAIDQGDRQLLTTLINQGVNLNQITAIDSQLHLAGRTPLTAAIVNKNQVAATLLLDNGAQLNFPDRRQTPLTAAIKREQWEIVNQLLTRGANYNQADPSGQTPLNQAISKNNIQLVRRLLDMGANPNQTGAKDYTPLMATLQPIGQPPKDRQIIQALLDSGAELGKKEMFRAIRDDHVAIVQLFLDHGWDINRALYDNHTSFSAAVGYSTPAMAQLMLDRGASTVWRGHHNFTLMDLAEERDSQEMIRFLRLNKIQ